MKWYRNEEPWIFRVQNASRKCLTSGVRWNFYKCRWNVITIGRLNRLKQKLECVSLVRDVIGRDSVSFLLSICAIAVNNIVMSNILLHSHSIECVVDGWWIDKIYTAKINLSPFFAFAKFFLSFLFYSSKLFHFIDREIRLNLAFEWSLCISQEMKIKHRILLMKEGKVRHCFEHSFVDIDQW